ncbi:MAG: glycosyltransferase family 2 protein [Candidatus Auribacter fodinae]|jgi:GT2 family glycosyltransferase|uniref:Glycosyltransferase family 2 protein n=1 Tax=Candidatus Auribacter fodinae TaxID=2093366 RepID=A0A3A4R9C5_9BACT|nr:MAG: glycosyltransferase family 2 protein [Candidatus Auribacter fodinae]
MKPIDIVILSHNRKGYLQRMVTAITGRTHYPFRLIVADNNSDADTREYLASLKAENSIDILELNETNLFMNGWHAGLRHVISDVFVLSDPDIVVPDLHPCWLSRMYSCFEDIPELVRLGAALSMDNIPPCWNRYEGRFLALKTGKPLPPNKSIRQCVPDTTLQMIRSSAFAHLNGFSAETVDFEFLKQLNAIGWCGVHQDIICTHLGWDEYRDYPDYLRFKNETIREYREVRLIPHS